MGRKSKDLWSVIGVKKKREKEKGMKRERAILEVRIKKKSRKEGGEGRIGEKKERERERCRMRPASTQHVLATGGDNDDEGNRCPPTSRRPSTFVRSVLAAC